MMKKSFTAITAILALGLVASGAWAASAVGHPCTPQNVEEWSKAGTVIACIDTEQQWKPFKPFKPGSKEAAIAIATGYFYDLYRDMGMGMEKVSSVTITKFSGKRVDARLLNSKRTCDLKMVAVPAQPYGWLVDSASCQ